MGEHSFLRGRTERAALLQLVQTGSRYEWTEGHGIWVTATLDGKKNLFSAVGVGARNALFVVRGGNELTLAHAIRYRGRHYFLTAIVEAGRHYKEVSAAEALVVGCEKEQRVTTYDTLNRPVYSKGESLLFPACVTEKYTGYQAPDPMPVTERLLVLVTPKCITLKIGDAILVDGEAYTVEITHELDEYKNEYEVRRRRDA